MTWLRRASGRAMDMLFPWPSKGHRKAAIKRARDEAEASREQAGRAATVERSIAEMAARNGFAAAIAAQIAARQLRGEGQ